MGVAEPSGGLVQNADFLTPGRADGLRRFGRTGTQSPRADSQQKQNEFFGFISYRMRGKCPAKRLHMPVFGRKDAIGVNVLIAAGANYTCQKAQKTFYKSELEILIFLSRICIMFYE